MMKKRISCLFAAVMMLICLFSATSFAEEKQYLHINYTDNENPLEGVSFSLYYLGAYDNGTLKPDATFSSYQVDFDIADFDKRKSLAVTLEAYVLRDNIKALCSGLTDENGFSDLGGEMFSRGVYLLTGEKHYQYDKYYVTQPVIIMLPLGDINTVVVRPKYESEQTDDGFTAVRVIKAWKNDSEENRPTEIEVQLLNDGEIADTVKLNESNMWQYVWTELDASKRWTVTEKDVAEGYTVSVSLTDNTFLITNAKETEEEEPPTVPDTDDEPEIPETGMLMWPVPYLALAGLLVFIIGFVYYKKSEIKNDTKE